MKWIGQHIWDFISRFRNDVYLEDLSDAGTDTDKFLVVDTNSKVRYRTGSEVLSDIGGASSSSDVTGITLSGDSGSASDTSGNLDLTIEGGNAITTSATGTTVTIDHTDTSSASSVNNSGSTVIQDITIDTYGHITGLASATLDLGDSLSFDGTTSNGVLTYKDADEISVEDKLTYDGSSSALIQTIAPAGNFTGYSQLATTASGWTTGSNVGVGIQVGFLKDDDTQALASGGAATWYGLKTDASDTASNNVGNTYLCGVLNDLDFVSANGDFAVTCGIENDLDGGDTQYGVFSNLSGATAGTTFGIYQTITDGGYDLYFRSSADNADHAYWQTGAAGATTIATVDSGATAAHLTLDIHGDMYHDSRTGVHKWYTNGNSVDYFGITVGGDGQTTMETVDANATAAHFEIAADGNITLDAAGDIFLECGGNNFSCDAGTVDFSNSGANRPSLFLTNNADDATGPFVFLKNMRDGNGLEDDDVLGTVAFLGEDASGNYEQYGSIVATVVEADNADETGQIKISVANDGTERNGITITADKGTAEEVDVTIANGTSSTTTIAGHLRVVGNPLVGWHGSSTRIKILPRDFVANDVGRPLMIEDDSIGSNELFLHSFSTSDAFAYVPIPAGYKATHVKIFGNTSGESFYVYEGNIDSKTIVDIATGATAIGSEKTLGTQLTSDDTNYLLIRVTSGGTAEEIHGGYATIAAV